MPWSLIAGGPLQMLFSLLLMQGLSLTMWRSFLSQTIPRFDPQRYNGQYGNRDEPIISTTPASNVSTFDPRLISMIPPQQLLQLQQMNLAQQQAITPNIPYPAIQVLTPPSPQVIVIPQLPPQQQQRRMSTTQGSASTNFPVQVESPQNKITPLMFKRMLRRPPKTTSKPVYHNMHAGVLHYSFVTPRVSAGFRRYVISPVTAKLEPQISENSVNNAQVLPNILHSLNLSHTSTPSVFKIKIDKENLRSHRYYEDNNNTATTLANLNSTQQFETNTENYATEIATQNHQIAEVSTSTESQLNLNYTDKPIMGLTTVMDIFNTTSLITDNLSEDFSNYIKNISALSQIDSNQSPSADINQNQLNIESYRDFKNHTFKRVCYYLLNDPESQLLIKDIDPFICTHLIIGFAGISANDLLVPKNILEDPDKYRQLSNLKGVNRKLKVMISVGDNSGTFSKMVANEQSRDNFVASALDVCDLFEFDGIDIDWEFPAWKNGAKHDKNNFISLLEELRIESIRRFRDDFIISVAVGTPLAIATAAYNIPLMARAVDFINLMSYDFHYYRADRPYTGHHSPLYPRPMDKGYFVTLNAAWSATYWANKGMPLEKIMLGVSTYARTFSLVLPISQGMDAPVNGRGLGGGKLNYTSVCAFLSSGATKEFDPYSQVPFAYKDYDWVAYENENSVALKAQWVVKANMGGVMTFAINYDDSRGSCRKDGKKFPLQKSISSTLELASLSAYRKISHTPDVTNFINN